MKLHGYGSALLVFASCLADGQDIPAPSPLIRPNQELRVSGLPALRSESHDGGDVLATSLATVLNDKSLCCERGSALEDRLPQSDPVSLKDVAAKLQGRQLASDGHPVMITAEFVLPDSLNSGQIVHALATKHAPLMSWNDHLYVAYGVIYDDTYYADGSETYVIKKILLWDTRFSDSRREVVFNREKDGLEKIAGVLFLTVAPQ